MKSTLLYVDDEPTNLYLFEILFEDHYNVKTAGSGEEALEMLAQDNYDINYLITDLTMPEMDGFELLEKVKTQYPRIQRYILTAHSEKQDIKDAVNKGLARKYLKKLMRPEDMIQLVLKELNE